MPAKDFRKPEPASRRAKVQFTDAEYQLITDHADRAGLSLSKFIAQAALAAAGSNVSESAVKPKPKRLDQLNYAEIHHLAMQVKKLGVNVNQIAHQANLGVVPVTRPEMVYILNQIQLLLSQAFTCVERGLK